MKTKLLLAVILPALVLVSGKVFSQDSNSLKFSGDLRLRFEKDYSVTNSDGSGREDRDRARYRFRFGLKAKRGEHIEVGARLATGSPTDQQSPHQTFGDDLGKKNFNMDRAYFKYSFDKGWVWAGKNGFPFWKQNEMFWDDDVNPEGVSASYTAKSGDGPSVTFAGGQYFLNNFGEGLFESTMSAIQASLKTKASAATITAAAGIYIFNNKGGDVNAADNFNALDNMDHNIFVASAQAKFKAGNTPIQVGADFMKNLEDPTAALFRDATTGFVAQVTVKPGKWTLAAYYANIEKYAVIPTLAQDDWWRFGPSGHTGSSDLKGFELRAAYDLGNKMNLVARHYITEEIEGSREANRFRLDFNIKY